MKTKMKVRTYLWVAAIASALFLGSCANDDAVNNVVDKGTAKTTTGTTFITTTDAKTRTHAKTDFSTKFDYFWDKIYGWGYGGDRIFVESTPGTWLESDLGVLKDTEGSVATFNFPGTPLTNSDYMVYYSKNRVNNDVIKIPETQDPDYNGPTTQLVGDCGVGKATRTSSGTYLFKLHHKAAYAAVRWFCSNNSLVTSGKYKYYSVIISADEPMSGEYRLPNTENGHLTLVTAGGKSIYTKMNSGSGKVISTSLSNVNTAFFCIPPGTYHNIKITVKIQDGGLEGTMYAKYYPVLTFKENELTPIQFDLKIPDYSNRNKFYLWGAKQHYWYGHESEQKYDGTARPDYPKAGDPNGRYANLDTYPLTADMPQASCPNPNETLWYIQRGNPIWDSRPFTYNGTIYFGGVWFKKKAKIPGFSASVAPNGVDYRPNHTVVPYTIATATPTQYTNQDLSDYFFLPALGRFSNGKYENTSNIFYNMGETNWEGSYWVNGPRYQNALYILFPALYISPTSIKYEYTGQFSYTSWNTGTPLWTGE